MRRGFSHFACSPFLTHLLPTFIPCFRLRFPLVWWYRSGTICFPATMPARRLPELVNYLPTSQASAGDNDAEAAMVLASMPASVTSQTTRQASPAGVSALALEPRLAPASAEGGAGPAPVAARNPMPHAGLSLPPRRSVRYSPSGSVPGLRPVEDPGGGGGAAASPARPPRWIPPVGAAGPSAAPPLRADGMAGGRLHVSPDTTSFLTPLAVMSRAGSVATPTTPRAPAVPATAIAAEGTLSLDRVRSPQTRSAPGTAVTPAAVRGGPARQPARLVVPPPGPPALTVVAPPLRARLSAISTQRVLTFTDLNPGGGDRSLTQMAAPAKIQPKKAIRKPPARARAKRALNLGTPLEPAGHGSSPAAGTESERGAPSPARDTPPSAPGVGPARTRLRSPADAKIHVTMTDLNLVLAEGMRPVCAHLASLSKQLGEVKTTVNRMSTSLHTQGVGNERTAHAVVQLQGAVKGVYGVVNRAKSEPAGGSVVNEGTADPASEQERMQLAVKNEEEVRRVRDVAKKMMLGEIVGTNVGLHVMPSGARSLDIFCQAVEQVRRVDRDGAEEYLDSRRVFLSADGRPADKKAPVSEKLNRVRGHLMESLRKVTLSAYFPKLGIVPTELTKEGAEEWLYNSKYAKSRKAEPAINAALKAMFLRTGQSHRVVKPKSVGDVEYVNASMGHIALITHWACSVFEKAAGVRKVRRTGNDDVRTTAGANRWCW